MAWRTNSTPRRLTGTDPAFAIIRADEGLRLDAYRDTANIPTIGWGHSGPDVRMGMTISEAQALAFLVADTAHAAAAVDAVTHDVQTGNNQFSAMVSLTFNIGATAFRSSSVLRDHREGEPAAAASAFLMWDKSHVNGKLVVLAGLLRRRKEEAALYLKPDGVRA